MQMTQLGTFAFLFDLLSFPLGLTWGTPRFSTRRLPLTRFSPRSVGGRSRPCACNLYPQHVRVLEYAALRAPQRGGYQNPAQRRLNIDAPAAPARQGEQEELDIPAFLRR